MGAACSAAAYLCGFCATWGGFFVAFYYAAYAVGQVVSLCIVGGIIAAASLLCAVLNVGPGWDRWLLLSGIIASSAAYGCEWCGGVSSLCCGAALAVPFVGMRVRSYRKSLWDADRMEKMIKSLSDPKFVQMMKELPVQNFSPMDAKHHGEDCSVCLDKLDGTTVI